jgi:NAD-dependent dihydropyrimidine dehydrogenase PreA subunit
MFIQVNQALCAGCGTCVEVCSVGAIQLADQRPVINDALCTQCDACIAACPNGAIAVLSIPTQSVPIAVLPAAESAMISVPAQTVLLETETPARGLAPLAGAALAFLGREVAPRLADALLTVLERKLARPITTITAPVSPSSRGLIARGRGERRQARYRGGRTGNGNHRERR